MSRDLLLILIGFLIGSTPAPTYTDIALALVLVAILMLLTVRKNPRS